MPNAVLFLAPGVTLDPSIIGGGLSDGDYGDITVSGGATVMTIDPDVVTFAKIQNILTSRLLGRSSGGTGDVEEIQIGSGLTLAAGILSSTGSYTDEAAQDAVGNILTDTAEIDFTYNDAAPTITADLKNNSIPATRLNTDARTLAFGFSFGDGINSSSIAPNMKVAWVAPVACTMIAWYSRLSVSGSASFTVQAATGVTGSLASVGGTSPAVSSALGASNTSLDWTTVNLAKGDVLEVTLASITTAFYASIVIVATRT